MEGLVLSHTVTLDYMYYIETIEHYIFYSIDLCSRSVIIILSKLFLTDFCFGVMKDSIAISLANIESFPISRVN